jgi:hypothetical protein
MTLLVVGAWGLFAAQFCAQACLFLAHFVFALIGFLKGEEKVPRRNNVAAMASSISGVAVFSLLFFGGFWIIGYLQLDPLRSIAFWIGVAISVAYIAPQVPTKLKNFWRDAMHEDAFVRRAFENAKNFRPSKPPEQPH